MGFNTEMWKLGEMQHSGWNETGVTCLIDPLSLGLSFLQGILSRRSQVKSQTR